MKQQEKLKINWIRKTQKGQTCQKKIGENVKVANKRIWIWACSNGLSLIVKVNSMNLGDTKFDFFLNVQCTVVFVRR